MPSRRLRYDDAGQAVFAGARVRDLASSFGTPVYVFDEDELRERAAEYIDAAGPRNVVYAGKAMLVGRLLRVLDELGLGLDVVSEGELEFALRLGFPAERIVLHGVYKSRRSLELAAEHGIGCIVIDAPGEVAALDAAARAAGVRLPVQIRLNLGIDAHTHRSLATGVEHSQFGIPVHDGQAGETVREVLRSDRLRLLGYHSHIGSSISELAPFLLNARAVLEFSDAIRRETDFWPTELDLGGGLGIAGDDLPSPRDLVEAVLGTVRQMAEERDLEVPRVLFEPGRSLVGPAGATLYRVVQRKVSGSGTTYLVVDGGMSDNPRPALYSSYPEFRLAEQREGALLPYDVVGLHCETGDVLARGVLLPETAPGDILIALDTGAYNHSMASHYNRVATAPVVFVREGVAFPATRRDVVADWLRLELGLS